MASSVPEESAAEETDGFKKLGAKDVVTLMLTREQALEPASAALLEGAGGVFFSGGDQSRLTAVLLDTPVHKKLLDLYEKGAVIGGTSAGAAVMSEVMITGDEVRKPEAGHEFETLQAANVITTRGFGFVRKAVIDQHFVTRKRHNRLISLLAEHPDLVASPSTSRRLSSSGPTRPSRSSGPSRSSSTIRRERSSGSSRIRTSPSPGS
jgi:cyanophycinase